MDSTQSARMERGLAMVAAGAVHVGLLWGLSNSMRSSLPEPVVSADEPAALQVVWIHRRSPAPVVRSHEATAISPRRRQEHLLRAPTTAVRPADMTPPSSTSDATPAIGANRPLSAVYALQARQWAEANASDAVGAPEPLADRQKRLPGVAGERFRMPEQRSAAKKAVDFVGMLFGAGDPKEPCNSNRERIAGLAVSGDSAALQQELEFERRLCRP